MFTMIEEGMSYRVRTHDDIHTTIRHLTGGTVGEVVDKAFRLYAEVWNKFPDYIELEIN